MAKTDLSESLDLVVKAGRRALKNALSLTIQMVKWLFVSVAALFWAIFPLKVLASEQESQNKNQIEEHKIENHIYKAQLPVKDKKKERNLKDQTIGDVVFGKEVKILVTGYSSTVDQCDGDPVTTASGTRVHLGTMACPPEYPFGTTLEIEGKIFVCEDRGGKIKGNHFDRWFETRGEALAWGKRTVTAKISL